MPADTLSARIGVANHFRRGDAPAPIRTVVDNSVINNNGDGNTVTGSTVAGSTGRTRSTGNKVNDVALEEVLREWTLVG